MKAEADLCAINFQTTELMLERRQRVS